MTAAFRRLRGQGDRWNGFCHDSKTWSARSAGARASQRAACRLRRRPTSFHASVIVVPRAVHALIRDLTVDLILPVAAFPISSSSSSRTSRAELPRRRRPDQPRPPLLDSARPQPPHLALCLPRPSPDSIEPNPGRNRPRTRLTSIDAAARSSAAGRDSSSPVNPSSIPRMGSDTTRKRALGTG